MKKIVKYSLSVLFILLLLAGSVVLYGWLRPTAAPGYVTEAVQRGDIENTVLANGMLHPAKLVNVGAQESGQIKHLAVSLGDQVRQGQLIAQIDSLSQQNALKQAQASLASIKAQYRAKQAQIHQASLEYQRQKQMLAEHASSRADYEVAEANLVIYQAELEQLKAEQQQAAITVDSAKVDLGYTTIAAPMAGTVVYTAVEQGQTVNANQSTPTIIELAQLDTMIVKAQISEADVIHVHPGQAVYFTILGQASRPYRAQLRAIEPGPTIMDGDDSDLSASDDDAIYYNGLFQVANPNHTLRIGMTAQVSIVLEKAENSLLVPAQVLRPKPGGRGRYQVPVLVGQQIEYRDVKVGINNKIRAQILEGLDEGELVVVGAPGESNAAVKRRRPPMGF